jgi:hypothetical protein
MEHTNAGSGSALGSFSFIPLIKPVKITRLFVLLYNTGVTHSKKRHAKKPIKITAKKDELKRLVMPFTSCPSHKYMRACGNANISVYCMELTEQTY